MGQFDAYIARFTQAATAADVYEDRGVRYGVESYTLIARQLRAVSQAWLQQAIDEVRRLQAGLPRT